MLVLEQDRRAAAVPEEVRAQMGDDVVGARELSSLDLRARDHVRIRIRRAVMESAAGAETGERGEGQQLARSQAPNLTQRDRRSHTSSAMRVVPRTSECALHE